ncbi:MAG TPA: LuxR C-terminal-related transcriptional regulator [Xanthomonadales bacterium]|nr:LuxR C-terminal-related transcriptional regulator [Xanthomonadales bacterium]
MIFATGEPAYAVDRYGTIVAWNAAASRTLGYPASEALGKKCWELLQGRDAFGNQYCGERCPLREMAFQHKAVNRCRMSFHTAERQWRGFTVTTLALFDSRDAALIHLCREEPAASHAAAERPRQPAPGSGPGRGVLTPRERQVLEHLASGHSTREIATLLSISVSTVRRHIEHILHKLHAHSRLEAVAVSRRLGLHKEAHRPFDLCH